jgi:hypothetical protein
MIGKTIRIARVDKNPCWALLNGTVWYRLHMGVLISPAHRGAALGWQLLAISAWFSSRFGLSYRAQSECSSRKMKRSIDKSGAKLPNDSYACEPIQSYLDM